MADAPVTSLNTTNASTPDSPPTLTPWRVVPEAAQRARVGPKQIYGAVKRGELRAAKIGGRGRLVFKDVWIDEWIERTSTPVDVGRGADRGLRIAR